MPESASSTSISGTANTTGEYVRLLMLDSEGRNWTTWKKRFYLLVVARGHKSHLEDKVEILKKDDSKFDTWEMIKATLMERMISTIPDSIYSQIQDQPTVKLMYDELIMMFEMKSLIFVMVLQRKLMTASYHEGADLGAHFDNLKKVQKSLSQGPENLGYRQAPQGSKCCRKQMGPPPQEGLRRRNRKTQSSSPSRCERIYPNERSRLL
jgi:hypothetical protein